MINNYDKNDNETKIVPIILPRLSDKIFLFDAKNIILKIFEDTNKIEYIIKLWIE